MYWLVGEYLSKESGNASLGDAYIDTISAEINRTFPGIKGFNRRGLYRMKQFYDTYKDDENPSAGLILCASKDDEVVDYSMSRTMSPMMVAEYQLQLPDKDILQRKLQELIDIPMIEEE